MIYYHRYEGCMSKKVLARSLTNATKCCRKVVEHSMREEELVLSIGREREWRGGVPCEHLKQESFWIFEGLSK